jgi:hypothetical protein
VVMNNTPWSSSTIFGTAFDPRSGYMRGGLIVSGTDYVGDPSCAAPRDGSTEVICAIGSGLGQGFGTGTFNNLMGFGFDPAGRTTTPLRNLGSAPAGTGFWTGVGCASPNTPGVTNQISCAVTIGTQAGSSQTSAVSFDPRTANAPRFSAGNVFSVPGGAAMVTSPSCISLNVVNNQIHCGVVDSNKQSWAFSVNAP